MSNFSCPLIKIPNFGRHPNADSLMIVEILGTRCIFKDGDFKVGDWAVLIPIDSVVPLDHLAFNFLAKGKEVSPGALFRIRATRLRGIFSDGILIQAGKLLPDLSGLQEGQDVSGICGIKKYEPEIPVFMNTGNYSDPGIMPSYGLENYKKFKSIIQIGEKVAVTEKIHGCNARFGIKNGEFYAASHYNYKTEDERNLWWQVAKKYQLKEKLETLGKNLGIYGEIVGLQDLKYGFNSGNSGFFAFDIYNIDSGMFLDYDDFKDICNQLNIPTVPELYVGPYDHEIVKSLVNPNEGNKPFLSKLDGKTLMEGAIIRTTKETFNYYTNRSVLKYVSEAYLLRHNGTEYH